MNSMKAGKTIKNHCRLCNRQTNHIVKSMEVANENVEEHSFYSTERYAIIQCLGCESYSFRREYEDNQTFNYDDHGHEEYIITIDNYPLVLKEHKALDGAWYLPEDIKLVYRETVAAFAADCKVLAAVGCRAIIEAVCLDKKIVGKDLELKINNLLKNR